MPYSGFDQKLRESRNVTTASAESAVWPAMRAATAHASAWKDEAQRVAPSEAETTGVVGRFVATRAERVVPARADRAGDFVRGWRGIAHFSQRVPLHSDAKSEQPRPTQAGDLFSGPSKL